LAIFGHFLQTHLVTLAPSENLRRRCLTHSHSRPQWRTHLLHSLDTHGPVNQPPTGAAIFVLPTSDWGHDFCSDNIWFNTSRSAYLNSKVIRCDCHPVFNVAYLCTYIHSALRGSIFRTIVSAENPFPRNFPRKNVRQFSFPGSFMNVTQVANRKVWHIGDIFQSM
jgi:hypothetical protein